MASNHDDSSCDEAASSLGDSNYDFIDDRSVALTDESEDQDRMTDSITYSDGYEVEQANNLTRPSHTAQNTTDDGEAAADDMKTPTYNNVERMQADSTAAADQRPPLQTSSTGPLTLDEPSVIDVRSQGVMETIHQVRIVEGQELREVLPSEQIGYVSGARLSIVQKMETDGLKMMNKAFKILYSGPHHAKEPIIQKIGSILAANPNSSRAHSGTDGISKFNVVPISSFEDSRNPEVVLIDSSGPELVVEECLKITTPYQYRQGLTINMTLADKRTVTSSPAKTEGEYTLSVGWEVPDLAICVTSEDSEDSCTSFRKLGNRHGVHTLVLSEFWTSPGGLDPDPTLPHLQLAAIERSKYSGRHWQRQMPIDLSTFLQIDAGQLNRCFACLFPPEKESVSSGLEHASIAWKSAIKESYRNWSTTFLRTASRNPPLIAFLLIGLLYSFFLSHRIGGHLIPKSTVGTNLSTPSQSMISLNTVSASPRILGSGYSSHSGQIPTVSSTWNTKSLSTSTDTASLLLGDRPASPKKSEDFQVHVLGDCHIVLRPPHWLGKAKRSPLLTFQISRGGGILKHSEVAIFDGVYALQVPREEAYGMLNVQIKTEAKPFLNKTFEVDFGSSWLKIAAWKRASRAISAAMQHDLSVVHSSLSIVYNQTKTELSTFVQNTKVRSTCSKNSSCQGFLKPSGWSSQARAIVIAQTKEISRMFAEKIHNGQKETSKKMIALSQELQAIQKDLLVISEDLSEITRDVGLSIYLPIVDARQTIFRQGRHFAHVASKEMPSLFRKNMQALGDHYRHCQKGALKAWWRIAGLPEASGKAPDAPKRRRR